MSCPKHSDLSSVVTPTLSNIEPLSKKSHDTSENLTDGPQLHSSSCTSGVHVLTRCDLNGDMKDDVVKFKVRIRNDYLWVNGNYNTLTQSIICSLSDQHITPRKLSSVLMNLNTFSLKKGDNCPLFQDQLDEIRKETTIDGAFYLLRPYGSFFDCYILRHIVDQLGTEDDREKLAQYKSQLQEYCHRSRFECPHFSSSGLHRVNYVMYVDEVMFKSYTSHALVRFRVASADILCIELSTLDLRNVNDLSQQDYMLLLHSNQAKLLGQELLGKEESVTHPTHPPSALLNQLTIRLEEFQHQQFVLSGLKVHKSHTSLKGLNNGHPISKTALLCHAEQYINVRALPPCHKEEGSGLYYRGDFLVSGKGCTSRQPNPVVASKNTTPFNILLPQPIDSAISDFENAWKSCYGKKNIIWPRHRQSNGEKVSGFSEVNVTAPLLLAIHYRSSFVSIRFDHFTTLKHLDISCHKCDPYSNCVLRTMACLTKIHEDTCDTLNRLKRKNDDEFEMCMRGMRESTSKYLVYFCDDKKQLPHIYIELPHFVVIKLHRGDKVITLAMLYQQVPPYYFGIPVSLCDQNVTTPGEYQELISSSREYQEINEHFPAIIEKVNQKLAEEREIFFTQHRPDLQGNERLVQIHTTRFDSNNKPDCKCRHLAITIEEVIH